MIKNKQIYLKKFTDKDREFYTSIYTDKALMKFITKPLDKAACYHSFDLILQRMVSGIYLHSPCVIFDKKSSKKVGIISLQILSNSFNTGEIGVIILQQYQRKGYAHLAKSMLINKALNENIIQSIIAICEKSNHAANQANKKLGFYKIDEFLDTKSNIIKIKWQITKQDIQ